MIKIMIVIDEKENLIFFLIFVSIFFQSLIFSEKKAASFFNGKF
jgi:hypothetical protein